MVEVKFEDNKATFVSVATLDRHGDLAQLPLMSQTILK
jgi:hypothetical protein